MLDVSAVPSQDLPFWLALWGGAIAVAVLCWAAAIRFAKRRVWRQPVSLGSSLLAVVLVAVALLVTGCTVEVLHFTGVGP